MCLGAVPQPRPFMPDAFQRPLLMPLQPPFAKLYLQKKQHDTDKETQGVSAIRSQVQPERKINKRTQNRLADIVRQTHLAIEAQAGNRPFKSFLLIEKHK